MHLSAWVALKECRLWNSHAFKLLPLYCLFQWIVYSVIHQLLCDVYCISVLQPGKCEASLQCRYSHSQYLSWSAAAPISASIIPVTDLTVLVLKCSWTWVSVFILINHSTLCVPSPASLWQWAYIPTYGCSAVANKNTVYYQVCSEGYFLSQVMQNTMSAFFINFLLTSIV